MKRSPYFQDAPVNYLFQEMIEKRKAFQKNNKTASLISLGIGDTTQPLPPFVSQTMKDYATKLSTKEGYSGYGDEEGCKPLREKIASAVYKDLVFSDEIFISDGAKCDIGRLQVLFSKDAKIGIENPSYPPYKESTLLYRGKEHLIELNLHEDTDFAFDFKQAEYADIIFICSPHNPTGHVRHKKELEEIVSFAQKQNKIIIFDSAYSFFIQDDLPRSIYEIPHAKEVAIELGSFSKIAGFSGLRLGWTVVPKELSQIHKDWKRITSTFFNGASSIVQQAGLAALQPEGLKEVDRSIQYYLKNTRILKEACTNQGWKVRGGKNSPYLWVHIPGKDSSWELFNHFLEKMHLIITPGVGFGSNGEGYIRISGFGQREDVLEAAQRIQSQ